MLINTEKSMFVPLIGCACADGSFVGVVMPVQSWSLTGVDAAGAALLANAGIAKLVVPDPARRALSELLPPLDGRLSRSVIRGFAGVELAVAAALLIPALRRPAGALTVALGAVFALLGTAGLLRRSSTPCGCLGGSSQSPLGLVNVSLGGVLGLAGVLNVLRATPPPGRDDAAASLLLAAIGSLALCLWLHRRLIAQLLVAPRAARAAAAVPVTEEAE